MHSRSQSSRGAPLSLYLGPCVLFLSFGSQTIYKQLEQEKKGNLLHTIVSFTVLAIIHSPFPLVARKRKKEKAVNTIFLQLDFLLRTLSPLSQLLTYHHTQTTMSGKMMPVHTEQDFIEVKTGTNKCDFCEKNRCVGKGKPARHMRRCSKCSRHVCEPCAAERGWTHSLSWAKQPLRGSVSRPFHLRLWEYEIGTKRAAGIQENRFFLFLCHCGFMITHRKTKKTQEG